MMAKKEVKKTAPKKHKPPKKEEKEDFRGIMRLAGKDVSGHLNLKRALYRVKGIGHTVAVSASIAIQNELSLNPNMRVGELNEEQIDKIDQILYNLQKHNVPSYLLNRNTDFKTGGNRHVVMNDLIFATSQDVDREKKMYSWRGYRHTFGQKVRGQRTRNTGRSGMAVGVLRKAVIAAHAASKTGGSKTGGKGKPEKK